MNSPFFKGLMAAILGCIASLISVNGTTPTYWAITILGVVLTYFGQHAIVKPGSLFGTIDFIDLLKGLLMAIGTGISTYIASLANASMINWHNMINSVLYVALLYLAKNFISNSKGVLGTE